MTSDLPRFNLRFPPDLQKRLKLAAIEGDRSLNEEILVRLERSFRDEPSLLLAELLQPIATLSDGDRAKVVELLTDVAAIISKGRGTAK